MRASRLVKDVKAIHGKKGSYSDSQRIHKVQATKHINNEPVHHTNYTIVLRAEEMRCS